MDRTRKTKVALFIALGILVGFIMSPVIPDPVRAQSSGLVCIADTTSGCPSASITFGGSPGGTLTVDLNIANSAPFSGFQISVKGDQSIINATSVSLAGNVLAANGGVVISQACINGVGNCPANAGNGPGVVMVIAAANVLASSGHLFSITYKILASGTTSISFQTGCTGTSNDSFCVTIANGMTNPTTIDPENLQTAAFNTSANFAITASPASQSIARGSTATYTISVASLGGFTGTVAFTTSISPNSARGPTVSTPPSVTLTSPGQTGASTLSVSSTRATRGGTYTIVITGSGGNISQSASVTLSLKGT